ncbi:unnamed protein product [Boreogadus saida]
MNHSTTKVGSETSEPLRYISKAEAEAIESELLKEYRFGPQQLIEIWGHACAIAITKERTYRSPEKRSSLPHPAKSLTRHIPGGRTPEPTCRHEKKHKG